MFVLTFIFVQLCIQRECLFPFFFLSPRRLRLSYARPTAQRKIQGSLLCYRYGYVDTPSSQSLVPKVTRLAGPPPVAHVWGTY